MRHMKCVSNRDPASTCVATGRLYPFCIHSASRIGDEPIGVTTGCPISDTIVLSSFRLPFSPQSSSLSLRADTSCDNHRLSRCDKDGDNFVRFCNGQWLSSIPLTTESICSAYLSAVFAGSVYRLDRATSYWNRVISMTFRFRKLYDNEQRVGLSDVVSDHVTSSWSEKYDGRTATDAIRSETVGAMTRSRMLLVVGVWWVGVDTCWRRPCTSSSD